MKKRYSLAALVCAAVVLTVTLVQWRVNRTPDSFERGEVTVKRNGLTLASSQEEALTLIRGYFSMRCGSFAKAVRTADGAAAADKTLLLSDAVRKNEADRVKKLRAMMAGWNCRYSYAGAELRIDGWQGEGDTLVCSLYEFVWFKSWYRGITLPADADLSGYGVRHLLRLRPEGEEYRLLADQYDEGFPTGAAAKGRLDDAAYVAYAGIPSEIESAGGADPPALPVNSAAFDTDFRPIKAIAYADKWTAAYNPLFPNLESIGGDCCNFTSQCLYAGGLSLTGSWTHNGKQMGSASWISSTRLYAKLTGGEQDPAIGRGIAVLRQEDRAGRYLRFGGKRLRASAVIFPGSPVFYRWGGGFAADGRWSHTAVCVGVMGDGTPAISCHTDEKYHIKWNYGGAPCDYGTVQLTPVAMY